MSWHPMTRLEPGPLRSGSPVSATARDSEDIDLFVNDQAGLIYSSHGDATTTWVPWFPIDTGFHAQSTVTVVGRDQNRVDLFATGMGGVVYWAHRISGDSFTAFSPIYPSFNRAHSQVTAIARDPDQIDLFVTTFEGQVFTTAWDKVKNDWSAWSRIDSSFSKSSYFNTMAAVSRGDDIVELFVTGNDGFVYQARRDGTMPWSGFVPVPEDGSFATAGSQVAAISRDVDHIDLFVIGFNNRVYNNSWETGRGWVSWQILDGFVAPDVAPNRPPITVVARKSDRLDVFVATKGGRIHSTTWDSTIGWLGSWRWIDVEFTGSGDAVSALWRTPDRLELFDASYDVGQDGAVYCTYWDPTPGLLRGATISFHTHDDDKDSASVVHVFVKTRLSNSLTPESDSDYLPNLFGMQRYQAGGELSFGKRNPYLAFGEYLGVGVTFDDPGDMTYELDLAATDITVNDVVLPEVDICFLTDQGAIFGDDTWIFDYTVSLRFDDGILGFSSTDTGGAGIILEQGILTHSGIGIENYLRTEPLLETPKAVTDAVLTRVTLELYTHEGDDNNKDHDTRLDVRIENRLNSASRVDLAVGQDLFPGDEFRDDGELKERYRFFEWLTSALPSDAIQLADIVLPMVTIRISPHGDDTWKFDYQITFEFTSPDTHKPHIYSWRRNGVILDQDNTAHVGVYQGRPFPTAPPPTAPRLTQVADDARLRSKPISVELLQARLDEFINWRLGASGIGLPALFQFHLGSARPGEDYPLPESYADFQSLINGDNGTARYVSAVSTLGQQPGLGLVGLGLGIGGVGIVGGFGGLGVGIGLGSGILVGLLLADLGNAYIRNLESERIGLHIYRDRRAAPLELTLNFKTGGTLQLAVFGEITILTLVITVNLTLDRSIIKYEDISREDTVVDLFSWIPEYTQFKNDGDDDAAANLLDRFVQVELVTAHTLDPGDRIHDSIRDGIATKLMTQDPFTHRTYRGDLNADTTFIHRTFRDDLNATATSWLLGGVSDDYLNTDYNNIVLNGIDMESADPTHPASVDLIYIEYLGPKEVFVSDPPADWLSQSDFTASTLDNIDHIVVLTMENRSFDHVLGYLSLPIDRPGGMGRQDVDGLKGGEANPYKGRSFESFPLQASRFAPGPPNGYESVHHAINGGQMDGFVRSHADLNNDAVAGDVMGYHTGGTVWAYDALARDFAIGHRWFSSHPGPTYPNRFYELTGRPNLDPRGFWEFHNSSPKRPVFTPTIFDYLEGARDRLSGSPITWLYFRHANSICTLQFFEKHTFDSENIVSIDDPTDGFFARAGAGRLPSVSFIDPHFVDLPPGSNCDEPPGDIADGQELVNRVVEAVVSGPGWNKTLLLIVYDEHGGFYDHVPPPTAARVSDDFPIDTFGLRVPAFVVSPWVAAGSVFGSDADLRHFDHTSILKTIARRFLGTPPYLGARYAAANDLSLVLTSQLRMPQFLPYIRHRVQHMSSQWLLDAGSVDRVPGAVLRHAEEHGLVTQDFCFEATEGGSFYIRVCATGLYVSVSVSDDAADESIGLMLIQDVKYAPTSSDIVSAGSPELQKWQFSRASAAPGETDRYIVSNQAFPNRVMQPGHHGDAVVLSQVSADTNAAWNVTSPLIN